MGKEKNTLWSFGDSFSEEVINVPGENLRHKYVREYLNGVPYKTWPKIVAEKLDYNYENHAGINGAKFKYLGCGNSNDSMFFNVNEQSANFKKGDIVIIGFTNTGRYQVPANKGSGVWTILPNQEFGLNTRRYLENFIERNENNYYVHEMMQKFKILETLSKVIGFTIYYWDWTQIFETTPDINLDNWILQQINLDNNINNFYMLLKDCEYYKLNRFDKVIKINDETDDKIYDSHWGKVTNDALGDIFYEHIKKRING